jgi:hypothetical protein
MSQINRHTYNQGYFTDAYTISLDQMTVVVNATVVD